jgi:hypothetical protein
LPSSSASAPIQGEEELDLAKIQRCLQGLNFDQEKALAKIFAMKRMNKKGISKAEHKGMDRLTSRIGIKLN